MTVAELIDQLAQFPANTVVSVSGYEYGITDQFTVTLCEEVNENANSGGWGGSHDEYGGTSVRVLIER